MKISKLILATATLLTTCTAYTASTPKIVSPSKIVPYKKDGVYTFFIGACNEDSGKLMFRITSAQHEKVRFVSNGKASASVSDYGQGAAGLAVKFTPEEEGILQNQFTLTVSNGSESAEQKITIITER